MSKYPELPGRVVGVGDHHIGIIAYDGTEEKYFGGVVPKEPLQPCHKSDIITPQLEYVLQWGNTLPNALGKAIFSHSPIFQYRGGRLSEVDREACWVAYFGHHARYGHYLGIACAVLKDGSKVATSGIIPIEADSEESLGRLLDSPLRLSPAIADVLCDLKLGVSV